MGEKQNNLPEPSGRYEVNDINDVNDVNAACFSDDRGSTPAALFCFADTLAATSEVIRRIAYYEDIMQHVQELPDEAPERKQMLSELADYYGSAEWKCDFAADEAGLLPEDLKRGVLSEDGIYNLL